MARARRWTAAALGAAVLALLACADAASDGGNCFVLLPELKKEPPFSDVEVAHLWGNFIHNLVEREMLEATAAPAQAQAETRLQPRRGQAFDWMRDGALGMLALQRLVASELVGLSGLQRAPALVRKTMRSYALWVGRQQRAGGGSNSEADEGQAEGEHASCSDGPALRASALITFAWGLGKHEDRFQLWNIIKRDLDLLALGNESEPCDLWKDARGSGFLWNQATRKSALLAGQDMAESVGDPKRALGYLQAAAEQTHSNLLEDHLRKEADRSFIMECPSEGGTGLCEGQGSRRVDGAVILSLIHAVPRALSTSALVAETVSEYNKAFCELYPVNVNDSAQGVPGVLYGRYANNPAGGDNPWIVVSASLASLLYQAAHLVIHGHGLEAKEVSAWRDALAAPHFAGTWREFVAAGDSVLLRLRHHLSPRDKWSLREQIDKDTGEQVNGAELVWSYSEVLEAIARRHRVIHRWTLSRELRHRKHDAAGRSDGEEIASRSLRNVVTQMPPSSKAPGLRHLPDHLASSRSIGAAAKSALGGVSLLGLSLAGCLAAVTWDSRHTSRRGEARSRGRRGEARDVDSALIDEEQRCFSAGLAPTSRSWTSTSGSEDLRDLVLPPLQLQARLGEPVSYSGRTKTSSDESTDASRYSRHSRSHDKRRGDAKAPKKKSAATDASDEEAARKLMRRLARRGVLPAAPAQFELLENSSPEQELTPRGQSRSPRGPPSPRSLPQSPR